MHHLLYFIRHGQTDWNAELRFQGQIDVPLNGVGRRQARRNGAVLRRVLGAPDRFDFIASPLFRARETMEIVRAEMGLEPEAYRTDSRLMELAYGDWQGLTLEDTRRLFPEFHRKRERDKWHFVPPGEGAESYDMLSRRFGAWLSEVTRPTVCVAHGGILRAVMKRIGQLGDAAAAATEIPQDRILQVEGDRLKWL